MEGSKINTTAEIVTAKLKGIDFIRNYDGDTG